MTTAPGYGDDGFFFDATGLQYEFQEIGFAGWLGTSICVTALPRPQRREELANASLCSIQVAWSSPAVLAVRLFTGNAAEYLRQGRAIAGGYLASRTCATVRRGFHRMRRAA